LQTAHLISLLRKSTTPYAPKYLIARISPYFAGAIVVAVPFTAYAVSILYSFYGIGSSFHDAGWSAYLIHDADLQIHNPPCVDHGVSWFNSHISPLFLATSALGHLAPLTGIQFYAACIGIAHTLPAIAVFWLLVSGYRMTTPIPCLAAALLALLFSCPTQRVHSSRLCGLCALGPSTFAGGEGNSGNTPVLIRLSFICSQAYDR
jgi:hypothetical protein